MGLYSRWKRRAYIKITNPVATANFQHFLNLTWSPGMRSDFRDIRFTTTSGQRCRYWIESYTSKTSAVVWIKVPTASRGGLILYYGNNQAVSEASGDDVFEFFEGCQGTTLNATKWPTTFIDTGGSITVTGGEIVIVGPNSNSKQVYMLSANTDSKANTIAECRFKLDSGGTHFNIGPSDSASFVNNTSVWYASWVSSNVSGASIKASTETDISDGAIDNNYNIWTIKRNGTTNVSFHKNRASAFGTSTTNIPTVDVKTLFRSYRSSSASTIRITFYFIRKYAATDPTLTVMWHGVSPAYLSRAAVAYAGTIPYGGTEYTFDPVNVDHGMTAGLGSQEVEMTNNVDHTMAAAIGTTEIEMGPVNIYHPIYPTATWAQIIDPVIDSNYLIGVTVSQSMDDAMAEAVFEYDGDAIGNYFSGDYMTRVHVNIPDYLGTNNCVFIGVVPSSKGIYDVAKDKMTMRAVDYGIFLTKQTMEIRDLSLLPPGDQTTEGSNVAKELHFDGKIKNFQIGMTVTGSVSGATGTIISLVSTTAQMMTLYPATGKFVDDETLRVGGVDYALADGRSIDIPYTPYYSTINPEDWVRRILGGDNWPRTTGIEPLVLESSGGYWNTSACPAVPFMFGSLEKKRDALKRVAAYMDYLWHIKPRYLGANNYVQSGYFIKKTSIDSLLNLPGAATITGPNDFAAQITLDQDGEMQVDVVKVRCQDVKGNWLEAIRSNSYFDAGEGPYREFTDEPKDICTQADLDAYATDMYNLYSARTCSWSATMLERSDLQLYQLLNISGMGIKVPTGTYRIIKISHEYGCAKNLTHIVFMLNSSFSILQKYHMTYKDSISKVQQIVEGLDKKKSQTELATVTNTDGYTITYKTEAGNTGKGRDSTSAPDTVGTIPIGAKVMIQDTRGGIVCIPIVGTEGSTTDLLVVDPPTIQSAIVDPTDHNYWYLKYTPGANNTDVSCNWQTGSYPTHPGEVSGSGSHTGIFHTNVNMLRIRFSGPNATYYVKLWGIRNGVYSTTGPTITITSGSDVTIGDPEEPEPFKQRASMAWGNADLRSNTVKWFNDGVVMAAGSFRLEITGWSCRWDGVNPPSPGWYEEIGTVAGWKAGAPGGVDLELWTGTPSAANGSLTAALISGATVVSKVFNREASTIVLTFTTATAGKVGLRCFDDAYTDNTGSLWIVLTQL